jgi:transposase-like protein
MKALKDLWQERISNWKSSGISIKSWCREHGIAPSTFAYWKNNKNVQGLSKKKEAKFIELPEKQEKKSCLTLSLKGAEIYLEENFDTETLYRCLSVLKRL